MINLDWKLSHTIGRDWYFHLGKIGTICKILTKWGWNCWAVFYLQYNLHSLNLSWTTSKLSPNDRPGANFETHNYCIENLAYCTTCFFFHHLVFLTWYSWTFFRKFCKLENSLQFRKCFRFSSHKWRFLHDEGK